MAADRRTDGGPRSPGGVSGDGFDYGRIPRGYYDRVLRDGHLVQRAWHRYKFDRVRGMLEVPDGSRLLDVGCGPGTFLGGFATGVRIDMTGIDVAGEQIEYARETYGTPSRRFLAVSPDRPWPFSDGVFDAATLIEVVEHLDRPAIRRIAGECARVLRPGGLLVMTTPNYASHWPLLEWLVGRLGPVNYEEQHVTRFDRFTVRRQLDDLLGAGFEVESVGTMHTIAPFVAPLSARLADRIASITGPGRWWPFGALIGARLRRVATGSPRAR